MLSPGTMSHFVFLGCDTSWECTRCSDMDPIWLASDVRHSRVGDCLITSLRQDGLDASAHSLSLSSGCSHGNRRRQRAHRWTSL